MRVFFVAPVLMYSRMAYDTRSMWNREEEKGASLLEYALTLALMAIACIASTRQLGTQALGAIGQAANEIVPGGGPVGGHGSPEPPPGPPS